MRPESWLIVPAVLVALCPPAAAADPVFDLTVDVTFEPKGRSAEIALVVRQKGTELRGLTLRMDKHWQSHYSGWKAEAGAVDVKGPGEVVWTVPKGGGTLRYTLKLAHRRRGEADALHDNYMAESWVVMQSEALVPRPRWRTKKGASSRTLLQLRGPRGWLFTTPFEVKGSGLYRIEDPKNTKARPRGWIIAGEKLARRHTSIAGCKLLVVSPPDQAARGGEVYDFLRGSLPSLLDVFEELPKRILVVSAGKPMWRGGLSGQGSVFLNAATGVRQKDGTSTVLHELVHVLTEPVGLASDGDWYIEGIPEYYCLEAQRRAGTMSEAELKGHLDYMRKRSKGVTKLRVKYSKGKVTQRAVLVLYKLDATIREATGGKKSLDDVARTMETGLKDRTTASFVAHCEQVTGLDLKAFFAKHVP